MNSLGIVILNLVLGQLDARLGFLIGQFAVGAFALLLWKGSSLPWYALAYFLMGGFRSARSLATAYIRSIVSGANMGLAFGMAETMTALALFLAPPLAGYLYDADPLRMYMVSLGVIAVSVLASVLFSGTSQKVQSAEKPVTSQEVI
jgi:hypothetical protein